MASDLKYLIVGTGGVGGSLAAFLHIAGNNVTCIARGEALAAMKKDGMKFHSDIKGERIVEIKACSEEEYTDKADVIFVTVKGYSVNSIGEIIRKASRENTIVIPLLNVYGTGALISSLAPGVNVLDGCIYIVGFKSGVGEITQMGDVFHIVFGVPEGKTVDPALLSAVCEDLRAAGIKVTLSDDINRDTFIKWSYISAMAVTGAFYDIPMGPIQKEGKYRDTFIGLTRESEAIGRSLGIDFGCDLVEHHLRVVDSLDPLSTASLQKDLKAGHESELQGQLFNFLELAKKTGVPAPTYNMVAEAFKKPR